VPDIHRHFTVTGFVSHEGRTALHWHPRLATWLPPGGHVELNEDPVQAMLREVHEETGLEVAVIGEPAFAYRRPPQLAVPSAMAVYDIPRDSAFDGPHQHIDFIYFTRPVEPTPVLPEDNDCWTWVDELTLRAGGVFTHPGGPSGEVHADVRELGLAAIAAARRG
jgi:8-oxo-dGTP pyrophosphatase MutT (NUDIX family)